MPAWVQIIVSVIGLAGVVIAGIFGIIQVQLRNRVNNVEKKSDANARLETENNILEQLIPLLERKDDALDRIALILEQYGKRIEYVEIGQDNLLALAKERCLAPVLLEEIRRYYDKKDEREVRQSILTAIFDEGNIQ